MKTHTGVDLQLHSDAAGLWYGSAGHTPLCWHHSLEEFLETDYVRNARSLMILGARENAWLLVRLVDLRTRHRLPCRIWVGTPDILRSVKGASPHKQTLFAAMRDVNFSASVGGWHQLTARDCISYVMVTGVKDHCDSADGEIGISINEEVTKHLDKHAAWPALSFLPKTHVDAACMLLASIIDPRWYVDRGDPDSLQKLYSYLGLKGHKHIENVRRGRFETPQALRARLLLMTLFPDRMASWFKEPHDEPEYFFHRVLQSQNYQIQGWLEAARLFVVFLRGCWLQSLAPEGRELFVPEHFFSRPDEVAAFKAHWATTG